MSDGTFSVAVVQVIFPDVYIMTAHEILNLPDMGFIATSVPLSLGTQKARLFFIKQFSVSSKSTPIFKGYQIGLTEITGK